MYLKLTVLGLLLLGWTNLAIVFLLVNVIITNFGKRIFAGFCSNFASKYNDVSNSLKIELFKDLNDMKKGEKISILEIGAGPGTNFKYFDREALVQTVEPNLHFAKYFDENRSKFPKLDIKDIKEGFGEDLSAAGIADESVDAVVMTLVLCSVQDQLKCLEEIKRVLKPGGKFFYMEHIIGDEGSTIRTVHKLLMIGGFWPFMADGCCTDRATDKVMETAGFGKLEQKKYDLPISEDAAIPFKICGGIVKPHLMGVATK
eukprot:GFUD01003221.1.p1 GENE.GFUD01003221.1~~GFUD01003221.1.p1  ORF type:complete len:259 (-),score=78.26 GFUD01003221.1:187-963(-)